MASKTLTAKNFSDLMDYSATSVRTMKNSAGQIGFAPHNLILASEDFSDSNWTKTDTTVTPNAAAAPDGTITADKISHDDTTASLYQGGVSVVSGQTYAMGIGVKYIDHQWVRLSADGQVSWVDIQNGVVGTDNSSGLTLTALTDNWFWVTIPVSVSDASFDFAVALSAGNNNNTETSGTSAYIWGAHLYENGLAGMFDVPEDQRALASLTKYLPNTSTTAARFLPRRENHEYIDGAWTQGLLVESEARTNLMEDALDFSQWSANNTSPVEDETGLDNTISAFTLVDNSVTGTNQVHVAQNVTLGSGVDTCFSVYAKADQLDWLFMNVNGIDADVGCYFDLTNGSVGTSSNNTTNGIEDVGGGWFRCHMVGNTTTDTSGTFRIYVAEADNDSVVDLDGTSSIIIWGAQAEAGSTPSSLIPTYGATRTRTAETFTQKEDKIIWPNTTYVDGTELVTNGTFDSDVSSWTASNATFTWSAGTGLYTDTGTNDYVAQALTGLTVNSVYWLTLGFDIESVSIEAGDTTGNGLLSSTMTLPNRQLAFVATNTTMTVKLHHHGATNKVFDNISVKEINPRALCVVMHGYMTYADEGGYDQLTFFRNDTNSGQDNCRMSLDTYSSDTGEVQTKIINGGTQYNSPVTASEYTPGINVAFKIAGRFLDNAVQGAKDGATSTETTTVPGLPDLSSTQTQWFYNFMGHITDLRVWTQDITEAGLTGATS